MNDMSGIDGLGPDDAGRFQRILYLFGFPGALPRAGMRSAFGAASQPPPAFFTASDRLAGLPVGNLTDGEWNQEEFRRHVESVVAFADHASTRGFRRVTLSKSGCRSGPPPASNAAAAVPPPILRGEQAAPCRGR